MTKRDMVKAIAEKVGVLQGQAQEIVQGVIDGITETLVQEGRIELRNFGVFEVKKRKPRMARNPRTGEEVMVPARLVDGPCSPACWRSFAFCGSLCGSKGPTWPTRLAAKLPAGYERRDVSMSLVAG